MLMGLPSPLISISCIVLLLILIPSVFNYKSQWNKWTIILHFIFVAVPLLLLIILAHFKDGLPSVNIFTSLLLVLLFFLIMAYCLSPS
ncbi:hypothetical protein ES332_D07G104800v1 [Gossypium tomentosum]|uniref:Uncharacterized protein n=1 Tax=Gossypium tomentosum TaxID=34277 RepID=A0A5D2K5K6_GOSTO|nr:hypothetical protein ES332_D07G104800v1 [Gossypium tomentosum]